MYQTLDSISERIKGGEERKYRKPQAYLPNRTPSLKRLHEAVTLHLEARHLVPRRHSGKGTHEQIILGRVTAPSSILAGMNSTRVKNGEAKEGQETPACGSRENSVVWTLTQSPWVCFCHSSFSFPPHTSHPSPSSAV